jgi:hypothetical protein
MEKTIESMFIESAEGRKATIMNRGERMTMSDPLELLKMNSTYGVLGGSIINLDTIDPHLGGWEDKVKSYTGRDVFAVYSNTCIVKNVKTDMAHRIYLKKEYGVLPEDYANLVRGYIIPGKIVFYKTTGYKKKEDIPDIIIADLIAYAIAKFGFGQYEICITNNGVFETLAYYQL